MSTNEITIRRASNDDLKSIGSLIEVCLNDVPDEAHLKNAFGFTRLTYVADVMGEICGFVDGFFTQSAKDTLRFEVDLMAVHPRFHGQGIARMLIAEVLQQAAINGAQLSRALVRVSNTAAGRAFHKSGFSRLNDAYELYISQFSPLGVSAELCVPVVTLTYSGYWLEGGLQPVPYAGTSSSTSLLHGAVVPKGSRTSALLDNLSFTMLGEFHWWIQNTKP